MKIALVDDDPRCLAGMEALCREYGMRRDRPVEVHAYPGGAPFLAAMAGARFEVVFLDIYMAGPDGIAVAKTLREREPGCILIFLTSSREFMPEAFACHAFDYLPKPIDPARVERVLDGAARVLPADHRWIELAQGRKPARVFLRDIAYAVTDAHYLDITLLDGTTLRQRMTGAEFLRLTGRDPRFLLANRGVILNVDQIRSVDEGCCVMEGGARLPLRVRDAGRVEQAVMDRNFEKIRRRQSAGAANEERGGERRRGGDAQ